MVKCTKLAVIADIHSNHIALEAALAIAEQRGAGGIIFLGDYISDCPYPQKTMRLIYSCREKYPCWFVRGNREDYMLAHRDGANDGWCNSSSSGSLLYTYENLTAEDLRFFENMPICLDIELAGCPVITACHASPASSREWIMDGGELVSKYLGGVNGDIMLCGHVHHSGEFRALGKKAIFCPAVGLPTDGEETGVVMLELVGGEWRHEFITIEYDKLRLIDEFRQSGLVDRAPYWSLGNMRQIMEGRDYSTECVDLARAKALAANCVPSGNIPEKYWKEAAKEIGLI